MLRGASGSWVPAPFPRSAVRSRGSARDLSARALAAAAPELPGLSTTATASVVSAARAEDGWGAFDGVKGVLVGAEGVVGCV